MGKVLTMNNSSNQLRVVVGSRVTNVGVLITYFHDELAGRSRFGSGFILNEGDIEGSGRNNVECVRLYKTEKAKKSHNIWHQKKKWTLLIEHLVDITRWTLIYGPQLAIEL